MVRHSIWAVTGLAVIVAYKLLKRRVKPNVIPKAKFLQIMREITEAAFHVLFEYAQVAVRVQGASGHRGEPFEPTTKIKENDVHLRNTLNSVQDSVLKSHNITIDSLVSSQEHYLVESDEETRAIVQAIPTMFASYTRGEFPTLPEMIWTRLEISDENLSEEIRKYFESRLEALKESQVDGPRQAIPIGQKNLIAIRVNESMRFKQELLHIVMNIQSQVRSHLTS